MSPTATCPELLAQLAGAKKIGDAYDLLRKINKVPAEGDCGPILPYVDVKRKKVAERAIRAIGRFDDPRAEQALFAVLESLPKPGSYTAKYVESACYGLGTCGSDAAFPVLDHWVRSKKADIAPNAMYAIGKRWGAAKLDYFIRALTEKGVGGRAYALHLIGRHGGAEALPAVKKFLRAVLRKNRDYMKKIRDREPTSLFSSEVTDCMVFASSFPEHKVTREMFTIIEHAWPDLYHEEIRALHALCPATRHLPAPPDMGPTFLAEPPIINDWTFPPFYMEDNAWWDRDPAVLHYRFRAANGGNWPDHEPPSNEMPPPKFKVSNPK